MKVSQTPVRRRRTNLMVVALVLIAVTVAVSNSLGISSAVSRTRSTNDARQLALQMIETLYRQESTLRAYTSTFDPHYIGTFRATNATFVNQLSTLREYLTRAGLESELPYVRDIDRIHHQWLSEVAAPLLADPSGDLARSHERTGELLFTTLENDVAFLSDKLKDATFQTELNTRSNYTLAIVEIAILTLIFGLAIVSLYRSNRRIERRFVAEVTEANDTLNKAQELAGVGNWAKDLTSGKLTWSDELRRIYGVSEAPVGDDLLRSFDHPEDAAMVRRTVQAALEAREGYKVEHRIVRADGNERFVLEIGEFALAENGSLLRTIGTILDITERKQAEKILAHLAHHDPLTDVPNRALLYERLSQSIAFAGRQNRSVGVLFIDLDRFKIINDSLGHAVGDALLVEVAHRLNNSVRSGDTVARVGGDEFVIVLADVRQSSDATGVAQKILDRITEPMMLQGHEVFVTTSIGISTYPEDGISADELLKRADVAMYQAKERGRNYIQVYTTHMDLSAARKLSVEQDLRKGLERNELVVQYQPIVSVTTGHITGFEALARWQHPTRGLVMPDDFIPIAEESGLIVPLGEFVLRTALEQRRNFLREGLPFGRLTVNISARQFQQGGILPTVAACVEEYQLQPGDLELELTESLVMRDIDNTLRTLHELKELGVSISIDDFGTGYSSLNYLKKFEIGSIKIDREFVRDINDDAFDEAIATAILTLARSLDVRVIAEGVETQAQLLKLRRLGCPEAQGYLFSPSLPSEAAARLLAQETLPRYG